MRILISSNADKTMYPLPWRYSSTCFNFKAPNITYHSEKEIDADSFERVRTLVMAERISDPSFIGKMKNLEQLYIYEVMVLTA